MLDLNQTYSCWREQGTLLTATLITAQLRHDFHDNGKLYIHSISTAVTNPGRDIVDRLHCKLVKGASPRSGVLQTPL